MHKDPQDMIRSRENGSPILFLESSVMITNYLFRINGLHEPNQCKVKNL
jgi:hypothetical protein